MAKIVVERTKRYSKSIGGKLFVDGKFVCYTLELPWKWNMKSVSCIPAGNYNCFWRYERSRIQVENIRCPGGYRVGVQFHSGTRPSHTKGCILLGSTPRDNGLVFDHGKAKRKLELAVFKGQYFPAAGRKLINLQVSGVLMDSRFDLLDEITPKGLAIT